MIYTVVVANGTNERELKVSGVNNVVIENNVYILYDNSGVVLFSAPADTLMYLEMQ